MTFARFHFLLALLFISIMTTSSIHAMNTTDNTKTIYLAGGCFWGCEKYFSKMPGILSTEVGYANSRIKHPNYEAVCTGETGAAEAVKVTYNPKIISLTFLLEQYYKIIDPTSLNQQGNDRGTQYRTGIYYTDEADKQIIEASLQTLHSAYKQPIAIECLPLTEFSPAEDYHQDYLDKNPQGYCHIPAAQFEKAKKAKDPSSLAP